MFAGGAEETDLMLKEAYRSLAKLKLPPSFEKVVHTCKLAYYPYWELQWLKVPANLPL